jgi:outer membrane receptor protein involved in Fe transport
MWLRTTCRWSWLAFVVSIAVLMGTAESGQLWAEDSPAAVWAFELFPGDREPLVLPTSFWTLQPPIVPVPRLQPTVPLPAGVEPQPSPRNVSDRMPIRRSAAVSQRTSIPAREASTRAATDGADVIRKTPSALGVNVQRRSPVVTDPRIQGSRVGQLASSGSYWLPARIDLDTVLSKFDSRVLEEVSVIPGPFSVQQGPGFHFLNSRLRDAPRFDDGLQVHAATIFDYQSNGTQANARQEVWAGDEDWGLRGGYSVRTGSDYRSGHGTRVPASNQSGAGDFAWGMTVADDTRLEVHYLRLDQNYAELPGQAFDIDGLVTDGVDVRLISEAQSSFDRLEVDAWYNRTTLSGNANSPDKRRQFPVFSTVNFMGMTNVDSMSTGVRLAATWGEEGEQQLTMGADAKHVRQELNELTKFTAPGPPPQLLMQNSPIPRSGQTDIGLFAVATNPLTDRLTLSLGARADIVTSDVFEDAANLKKLGSVGRPLGDLLGTSDFGQTFFPWLTYLTADYTLTDDWTLSAGIGHGERPPSLTELYAATPFMFLIQNGVNTITGDPLLNTERMTQLNLTLGCDAECYRGQARVFQAWVQDAITFEAAGLFEEQVQLRYVNTKLATFTGTNAYGEFDLNESWTPFAALSYVEGTDHTRNGNFATILASSSAPTERRANANRGDRSGILSSPKATEALPGISPLEARLGIRWHERGPQPRWSLELLARLVNAQNRVASSLRETPTPGFTTWDLRGRWQATSRWLLFAGLENFTDKNYREHLDFHPVASASLPFFQPGINFYCGSDLTW